jgi:hypothetical protein
MKSKNARSRSAIRQNHAVERGFFTTDYTDGNVFIRAIRVIRGPFIGCGFAMLWAYIAVALQFGLLAGSAQMFSGSETNITLNPGTHIITAYGAPGSPAVLLTTTNVTMPLTDWMHMATDTFDVTGFLSFTNYIAFSNSHQFFALQPTYTVGGTIFGLTAGDMVVLTDNGGDDLTVTNNGSFTFAIPLPYGSNYDVAGGISSDGAYCTVTNGTGTITTSNITNVVVTCSSPDQCKSGFDTRNCNAMVAAGCVAITNADGSVLGYDCNDDAYHWLLHVGPNGTGCDVGVAPGGHCNSLGALIIPFYILPNK